MVQTHLTQTLMVMALTITKKLNGNKPKVNPDTDGDGVNDGNDDLPLDPFGDEDTDGDGIRDGLDPDDDNDGLTDTQETNLGTNPRNNDSDGDGSSDGAEQSAGTNPLKCRFRW